MSSIPKRGNKLDFPLFTMPRKKGTIGELTGALPISHTDVRKRSDLEEPSGTKRRNSRIELDVSSAEESRIGDCRNAIGKHSGMKPTSIAI